MPSEESREEQARDLAKRGREALPKRDPESMSSVEVAITLLAQSIECLTSDERVVHLDLDAEQLAALRVRIGGQGPIRRQGAKSFIISFPDIELPVENIWSEGEEIPEFPTPEDVVKVMSREDHAHPLKIAQDWLLIDSLFVRDARDEEGDDEVEWDGT